MNKCDKCGGLHWRTAPCIQRKESTAALNTERAGGAILGFETQAEGVKGNFPPVDFNSSGAKNDAPPTSQASSATTSAGTVGDKDRPKFDKVTYQRLYMREVYRPRLKAKREAMK